MRVTMSKEHYNYLANHLVYIQRDKLSMIKGYSLDYDSYTGMLDYLNGYIKKLEHLLDNAIIATGDTPPPFMVIGSTAVISRNGVDTEYSVILPNGGHLSRQRQGVQVIEAGTKNADELLFKSMGENVSFESIGQNGQIVSIIYDPIFKKEKYTYDSEKYAV